MTYATANEVGFDYLRDQLVRRPGDHVLEPLGTAVVDEADSILIDEARIPLVTAGGRDVPSEDAASAEAAVRGLSAGRHFTVDAPARTVALTPVGVGAVEQALDGTSLFDADRVAMYSAVHDALHAHAVLKRDVDYVLHNGESAHRRRVSGAHRP